MSVSTKGFCENVLTLKAASGLAAGMPVAVSANDTVSSAGADAKFCGVGVNVNGGYAGVQLCGAVTLPYTGTKSLRSAILRSQRTERAALRSAQRATTISCSTSTPPPKQ